MNTNHTQEVIAAALAGGLAVSGSLATRALAVEEQAATQPAAKAADAEVKPAEPAGVLPTPDYTGGLLSRSTLTGDWGGRRQELARKGITVDGFLTQVGIGVVDGGRDTGWEYLGRGEVDLNLDTGKMGLWPGGVFSAIAEGHFGNPISTPNAGVLLPVDVNEVLPEADNSFVLSQYVYTQFLSEKLAVFGGKMTTITPTSGDMNEFAHGKGDRNFLNASFAANAVIYLTVPYSTYGAGALFMPSTDMELKAVVVDAHGRPDSAQFDSAFSNGATFILEGRYTTHFFGMTGHQLLGGTYATSSYTDLDQSVANLIVPGLPVSEADDSWCVYYNFDQYFYQPDPNVNKGIGVFGRAGFSDGQANPIKWVLSGGIGGKGMIADRPNDSFGIGYYYDGIAETQITSTLNFGDTQGFEAYYDIALTPWMHLSPDVQWVQPSQKAVEDSFIVGFRLFVSF